MDCGLWDMDCRWFDMYGVVIGRWDRSDVVLAPTLKRWRAAGSSDDRRKRARTEADGLTTLAARSNYLFHCNFLVNHPTLLDSYHTCSIVAINSTSLCFQSHSNKSSSRTLLAHFSSSLSASSMPCIRRWRIESQRWLRDLSKWLFRGCHSR